MKTYKTAQIAALIGVHPNTVRFYEAMKLLPVIPRTEGGYRVFTDAHLRQLRLLRTAFHTEITKDRLRQEVYEIVKTAAADDIGGAYQSAQKHLKHLREERDRAEDAIRITLDIIEKGGKTDKAVTFSGRRKVAGVLGITIDVLRDWERNGLIQVPRDANRRRKFGLAEMNRLKIIRTLRNAHYSMMSILRMLHRLDNGEMDIRKVIDTPNEDEDIVSAADRYSTALSTAEKDALEMLVILNDMRESKG